MSAMNTHHIYIASCSATGGIYHYLLDANHHLHFCDKFDCDRPMYLCLQDDKLHVLLRAPYDDHNHSALQTLQICADGSLKAIGDRIDTQGIVACHLCTHAGNVYVTNYLSGNIFGTNGTLDTHQGQGVNLPRQDAPHTHCVIPTPDQKYLLCTDLGLDTLYLYDEQLQVQGYANVPQGHGARHLAFSPDGETLFCVNELQSTVSVFSYHEGVLSLKETVSVLEKAENSTAAAIRVRGKDLYVSNRGADTLSKLHYEQGKLVLCHCFPCGGQSPRDFIIVGDTLLCANETSNQVTIFDMETEQSRQVGVETMEAPLCVVASPIVSNEK